MPIQQPLALHHTTSSSLTADNWREACSKTRQQLSDSIPTDWRLSQETLDSLPSNVLDIPRSCGLLSAQELEITELDDVDVLLSRIHSRQWSAVAVTTAYCKGAAIAHQLVNCCTLFLFDDAIARAKELDTYLEKNGKPIGPLHGLPISLKDQFDIKGKELNMGYAAYLGRVSHDDSAIVKVLRQAGAVFHCRTNIPQTLMVGETNNHVYGRTVNPYNNQLTCGGSSGGEGALIALKGSPCGLGTDIGGSVRIPANFNGLFGLRPTALRVPYGGSTNSILGQESIFSAIGPLSRSINGCRTVFKAILDQKPEEYDPYAIPLPFRDDLASAQGNKKSFGMATWDNAVLPSPPILRALKETKDALQNAGHEVIDFKLDGFERSVYLLWNILMADGGEDLKTIVKPIQEPWVDELASSMAHTTEPHSVYELYQLNREKEALQGLMLKKWLATASATASGRPIDGLILPVAPVTAPRFGNNDYINYTGLFNLLDLPATVFPVTFVNAQKDQANADYQPASKIDAGIQSRFDPQLMQGSPVCLQVVGRKYRCESTLASAEIISSAIRGNASQTKL